MQKRFRIPELVLGALFSAPLWILLWGWADSYAPTDKQKQECYEAAQKTGQKSDECKTFWERTTSDPVALFTLVLAISTGALWIATIGLYRTGERQLRIIGAFSSRQANDTRILQRAYLAVDIAGINVMTRKDSLGHVVIRNTGHLPAKKVSLFIDIKTSRVGNEEELLIGTITEQNRALMPGATMTVGSPPLKREDIGGSETGWVYVWGKVTYEDGFREPRFTEFCHRYPIARRKGDEVNGFRIAAEHGRNHEHGNDIG